MRHDFTPAVNNDYSKERCRHTSSLPWKSFAAVAFRCILHGENAQGSCLRRARFEANDRCAWSLAGLTMPLVVKPERPANREMEGNGLSFSATSCWAERPLLLSVDSFVPLETFDSFLYWEYKHSERILKDSHVFQNQSVSPSQQGEHCLPKRLYHVEFINNLALKGSLPMCG